VKPLSERERLFVEAYMGPASGNGTAAAGLAGYKGNQKVLGVQATRLLAKASVQLAIADRRAALESVSIADAKERREVLTTILRSGEADPNARIRAIDVANKMDGVYIEKHEHGGVGGAPMLTRVIHTFTDDAADHS
jgi:phage terminase small subunit